MQKWILFCEVSKFEKCDVCCHGNHREKVKIEFLCQMILEGKFIEKVHFLIISHPFNFQFGC